MCGVSKYNVFWLFAPLPKTSPADMNILGILTPSLCDAAGTANSGFVKKKLKNVLFLSGRPLEACG